MGSQKILTNEKFIYCDKEFQIYKTKKGAKLIKINNNYININNISIVSKINNKEHDDIILNNIKELNNLDINEISINNNDINYSIDGEEYVVI
jgi:hypothetical protein